MRYESPRDTAHTPQVGRRRSPCHRDLRLPESRNPRRRVLARDDQAANLDLLSGLEVRQFADWLCAHAGEGIPPRRCQVSFKADTHKSESGTERQRSVQVE